MKKDAEKNSLRTNKVYPAVLSLILMIAISLICSAIPVFAAEQSSQCIHGDVDSSAVISARSIASLLTFMDGFDNPENMIYIITTNHVEDLDPALIRPGRIDLSMYIGYIDNEVFDKFVCYHYGKHIPDTFEIRSGLTCAELQTKVMDGMTFEDILEYARAK